MVVVWQEEARAPDSRWKERGGRTVLIGIRKRDHVFGEDLGDTADAGGDDVEACTGGFEDGDAKGFGEGCVEEDGAADEDLVERQSREVVMGLGIRGDSHLARPGVEQDRVIRRGLEGGDVRALGAGRLVWGRLHLVRKSWS